jgi:hypothetical protein
LIKYVCCMTLVYHIVISPCVDFVILIQVLLLIVEMAGGHLDLLPNKVS